MDIVKLAESLGLKPRKAGKTFRVFCIYHQDTGTPNLTLYPENNRFYCYTCGAKGNIIDLYAKYKGITPDQAKRDLQEQNIAIKTDGARVEHRGKTREKGQYSQIYQPFIDYLQEQNKSKPDQEALNYLHNILTAQNRQRSRSERLPKRTPEAMRFLEGLLIPCR